MSTGGLLLGTIVVFLLRAALILGGGQHTGSFFGTDAGDHLVYHETALQLIVDPSGWFTEGGEIGYRAPGYFAFLWLIYSLVSPSFLTSQLATAFLGAVNCALLFLLTKKISTDRIAALAFWIRGLLPCFVIADTFVLSEPLFAMFLLSALVVVSLKPHMPTIVQSSLIGALVACCLLIREAAMLYPVIFMGYFWWGTRDRMRLHRVACMACFFIAFVLVLTPWMYRNYTVVGNALPLSYTAGVNLHIGNNKGATGNFVTLAEEDRPIGIKWGTPEFDRWHRNKALEYIADHPSEFMLSGFKKIAWFLWPRFLREDLRAVYQLPAATQLSLSMLSGVSSACLILLGIIGFIGGERDWFWWITSVFLLYAVAVTFVVVGDPRYRDAVEFLMIPYAASLLLRWRGIKASIFEEGSQRSCKAWAVVVVGLFILGSWVWVAGSKWILF